LLRLADERRKNEADSENDREPDQPHVHLGGGWLASNVIALARSAIQLGEPGW
jgi:hypothetical protein